MAGGAWKSRLGACLVAGVVCLVGAGPVWAAAASVTYTYDLQGRVRTALYDNGTCVVYSYDANGNRTAQTVITSGAPVTPTWGSGLWGCFHWSGLSGRLAPPNMPNYALASIEGLDVAARRRVPKDTRDVLPTWKRVRDDGAG